MVGWARVAVFSVVSVGNWKISHAILEEGGRVAVPAFMRSGRSYGEARTADDMVYSATQRPQAIVVLVRHGEKASDDKRVTGLSADGKRRAAYLARCAGRAGTPALPFGPPKLVMAPKVIPGESTRSRDTASPLAKALGLPIEMSISKGDHKLFASFVRAHLEPEGTVFAAWQHSDIPKLVEHLGLPNFEWPHECAAATWKEPDYIGELHGSHCYDAMWQVRFEETSSGEWRPVALSQFNEGFTGSDTGPCAQGLAQDGRGVSLLGEWRSPQIASSSSEKSREVISENASVNNVSEDLGITALAFGCLILVLSGAAFLSVSRQGGRQGGTEETSDYITTPLNPGAEGMGGGDDNEGVPGSISQITVNDGGNNEGVSGSISQIAVSDGHGALPGASAGTGGDGSAPPRGDGGQHLHSDSPDFSISIICDRGIMRTHNFQMIGGELKEESTSLYAPPPLCDDSPTASMEPRNSIDEMDD